MATGTYNFVSAISNVAFVGASILSLACIRRLALGLAFLAVCVSQNTIFRPCQNKIYFTINQWHI